MTQCNLCAFFPCQVSMLLSVTNEIIAKFHSHFKQWLPMSSKGRAERRTNVSSVIFIANLFVSRMRFRCWTIFVTFLFVLFFSASIVNASINLEDIFSVNHLRQLHSFPQQSVTTCVSQPHSTNDRCACKVDVEVSTSGTSNCSGSHQCKMKKKERMKSFYVQNTRASNTSSS